MSRVTLRQVDIPTQLYGDKSQLHEERYAMSQPVGVDQGAVVVVLLQPPVGEVFREPARCFFCG